MSKRTRSSNGSAKGSKKVKKEDAAAEKVEEKIYSKKEKLPHLVSSKLVGLADWYEGTDKFTPAPYVPQEDFAPPSDWPKDGDIDLATADLPHASADTEWWYVNSHLKDKQGHEYSLFASFFRIVKKVKEDGTMEHSHALTWAIVDPEKKEYFCEPLLDHDSVEVLREQFGSGKAGKDMDPRMRRAMKEVVKKGGIPRPDMLMSGPAKCSLDKLSLDYDGNTFRKDADGTYHVKIYAKEAKMGFTLKFKPQRPPTRQGYNGIVKVGLKAQSMFYYYIPRHEVTGTIQMHGKKIAVTGQGWYDHEFGGLITNGKREGKEELKDEKVPDGDYAWNWFSIQLDNGTDITGTYLTQPKKKTIADRSAVITDEKGVRSEYHNIDIEALEVYQSTRTTSQYPTRWSFNIDEAKIDLDLQAVFEEQEMVTLIAKPAFWEGRIEVYGTIKGERVRGRGFIERHGFEPIDSLDTFFKRVSRQVREQIDRVMPFHPTREQALPLITEEKYPHLLDGANIDVFADTIIKPLREVVDRGGKSWRSFAFLLCIDAVGGHSGPFKHWLALPEVMHVGSLIVDDIQDESETRRGGPSCHRVHGNAIAINAGTAAYFLTLYSLQQMTPSMTAQTKLRMYETYMLTLRAGHAGQAFDIRGLDYMMDDVVESGDGKLLEERVLCTHRLKSAVPAGNLARMGALTGEATDEQIEALGHYMEMIGLAFQIVDDVLNLRGFEGKTKKRAEDINAGKITFPVAKAMQVLDKPQRKRLWDIIKSKPDDQKIVDEAVEIMEKCGAIQAASDQASALVEEAWGRLDNVIEDSFYKMLLRSFGWYVLDRHY